MIRTVMVVDDEKVIREVAELALSAVGGWKTLTASTGKEALNKARLERPDLILLDVRMPNMDGTQVFAALRADEDLCQIPVIFLTATAQEDKLEALLAMGAHGVIRKPFNPMKLPSQVLAILDA